MSAPRIMPDPIPPGGGILTRTELEASLRVLRSLRTPVCASVVLTWGSEEVRAYVGLARAGYVRSVEIEHGPVKPDAPFRWDRVAATAAGLEYLRQIECGVADTPPCERGAT